MRTRHMSKRRSIDRRTARDLKSVCWFGQEPRGTARPDAVAASAHLPAAMAKGD